MLKRYETIGYGLAFVALCSFLLGWKMLVAPQRPEEIAELQKRLNITAENVSTPVVSENADDFLKIYTVNVAHTPPFKSRFIGYGIYLGQGIVLTAAHVVGHWPGYAQPHVLIAGLDLPASVLKQGSPEHTDLALLSVDQERLPISLQLRRNPLCKEPLQVGTNVIVAYPERTARSQIISPLLIPSQYRSKFPTLISEPQGSGSGVFNAERKCLIGIMSARVKQLAYQDEAGRTTLKDDGYAGYFVPVSKGATFIPPQYRF
jgi:hypothetical protein